MLIKKPADIKTAEITPKEHYLNRRQFMLSASAMVLSSGAILGGLELGTESAMAYGAEKLANVKKSNFSTNEKLNTLKEITSYNNFYELGPDKEDPAENAKYLTTRPWSVAVEGEVKKPKTYDIEELIKLAPLEERIYRLRCVEAWSMVIPWIGFPLSALIKLVEPTGNAKYIQFVTLDDPKRMPGQKLPALQWPYVEGLRMDEAMHPLTILSVGLYGEILPAQNGAPHSSRGAVEVRFQKHQVDRQDSLRRETTTGLLEHHAAAGVWLLFECQSRSRPSALDPGKRTANRRIPPAQDLDVQWLRRASRELV